MNISVNISPQGPNSLDRHNLCLSSFGCSHDRTSLDWNKLCLQLGTCSHYPNSLDWNNRYLNLGVHVVLLPFTGTTDVFIWVFTLSYFP